MGRQKQSVPQRAKPGAREDAETATNTTPEVHAHGISRALPISSESLELNNAGVIGRAETDGVNERERDMWRQLQGLMTAAQVTRLYYAQQKEDRARSNQTECQEQERVRTSLQAHLDRRSLNAESSHINEINSSAHGSKQGELGQQPINTDHEVARERTECGPHGQFYCVAMQGNREYMEDCFSTKLCVNDQDLHLFGVYDGHGGSLCAEFCAAELLKILANHAEVESKPERAMQAAFECLDNVFCELSHERSLQDGSTATVAIVKCDPEKGLSLTVGNVGDSRCVLARAGQRVEVLTRDHSPGLNDEAERIRDQGGMVIMCGGLARVQGCLAVSRALGDAGLKPFVTGTPEMATCEVPLGDEAAVLCIASDGVWDMISNEEAQEILLKYGPEGGANHLTKLALERGSDDNLTCMAIDLRRLGLSKDTNNDSKKKRLSDNMSSIQTNNRLIQSSNSSGFLKVKGDAQKFESEKGKQAGKEELSVHQGKDGVQRSATSDLKDFIMDADEKEMRRSKEMAPVLQDQTLQNKRSKHHDREDREGNNTRRKTTH